MPNPSTFLRSFQWQIVFLALAGLGVAAAGFEAGRKSVGAAALPRSEFTVTAQSSADPVSQKRSLLERDHGQITVREIAKVPFSELYDVLKAAPREQLLAWAADLERMPKGPRQLAAVTAYYKSLIQVDHRAAIEAVLRAQNLDMRNMAVDALTKAAPESIWPDIAEMMVRMPYPNRGSLRQDIISNWSAVDPVAASKFIAAHAVDGEDRRLPSLLWNWGRIDPVSAKEWLDADSSRQTKESFRFLVSAWAETDRPAAIHYLLANATRPEFADAINELAFDFVRKEKAQATNLMLLLPLDQAKGALHFTARETTAVLLGVPADYQRPPDEVARWMTALPVELWKDAIGELAVRWVTDDAAGATKWFDQLQPDLRNAAIAGFCRSAEADSVEQVLTLGQTITDRKLRDTTLGQFARNLRDSRQEAIETVNELFISANQKAYLIEVMAENKDGH